MTATRSYYMRCDDPSCEEWTRYNVDTVAEARKLARTSAGWTTSPSTTARPWVQDYCRRHSRR